MAFLSTTVAALGISVEGLPEDTKAKLLEIQAKINEIIAEAAPGS
jgi:hypothetical protein